MEENEEISEQIKQYKRRVQIIKELLVNMDEGYEDSKRFIIIQRYRLMKNMIKEVITNKWIKD